MKLPFDTNSLACIVQDSPWNSEEKGHRGNKGGTRPDQLLAPRYDVMDLADIHAMGPEINRVAQPQCHLWMWAIEAFLGDCEAMMADWGFPRKKTFIWVKTTKQLSRTQIGLKQFSTSRLREAQEVMETWGQCGKPYPRAGGRYWGKNCIEFLLLGTNDSSFQIANPSESQVFFAPSDEHSSKPTISYEMILRNSPGPRANLFARKERPGFNGWGNQLEAAQ